MSHLDKILERASIQSLSKYLLYGAEPIGEYSMEIMRTA